MDKYEAWQVWLRAAYQRYINECERYWLERDHATFAQRQHALWFGPIAEAYAREAP